MIINTTDIFYSFIIRKCDYLILKESKILNSATFKAIQNPK